MQGRREPRPLTTGSSRLNSASASRVPCRNSIGMLISARCLARSLEGFPAGCRGKPRNASPRTPDERRKRLRLRRHPPAERFSARDQRQSAAASPGLRHRGANRGMRDRRRIRPLAAAFHIGKLVAQRRDAALAEADRNRLHRLVVHACTGPVREHVSCPRMRRPDQRPRKPPRPNQPQFGAIAR